MRAGKLGVDSIQDLLLFVRTVERGSMTAAGVALGLSTALVSRRLGELERGLGAQLIDRSSRQLRLTPAGQEFHARAETALKLVQEAQAALHSKSGELRGTLRVSMPTVAADLGFASNFVALFRRHRHLSIEMHLSDQPVDVIGRGFDAAVFVSDTPERHPGDLVLGLLPTSLTAATSYLDRAGRPQHPRDLTGHRTVRAISERGSAIDWPLVDIHGNEQLVLPAGAMFLSDERRVLFTAIGSGAGIGRMPVGLIARASALEIVLPHWRFRPSAILATLRQKGPRSSKVAALMEVATASLRVVQNLAVGTPLEGFYAEQLALNARVEAAQRLQK